MKPLAFLCLLVLLLAGCSPFETNPASTAIVREKAEPTPTPTPTATATPTPKPTTAMVEICPSQENNYFYAKCYTPYTLRVAYGIETLIEQGFTGKGQTVVDVVAFGSPTLQRDIDVFDQWFGLPAVKIQVISPLGTVPFDPHDKNMVGWASETELDVQMIHAIAPDAGIVVMTGPGNDSSAFLELEQYAVSHHLGQIFSQSFGISEAELANNGGAQFAQDYADFYNQITVQQGWTIVSASGDSGATDYVDPDMKILSPTPTVDFPADIPWVTAVGGTTLLEDIPNVYNERAWRLSGGGVSKIFLEPDFQQGLSSSIQKQLAGQRGLPDVAADADPLTGMAFYWNGQWGLTGGTSASTPLWAGLIAIANQMAGHPLGFINPGLYKLEALQNARSHFPNEPGIGSSTQKDFRDITEGDNSFDLKTVHVKGFQAVTGWDAITGWGAPQASQFIPDLIAVLT